MIAEIATNFTISPESMPTIPETEEPNTLRIPISFVLCLAIKVAKNRVLFFQIGVLYLYGFAQRIFSRIE